LSDGRLVSLDGELIGTPTSHRECIDLAIQHKLDVYVGARIEDARLGYPWLDQALADDRTSVPCRKNGSIVGIRGKGAKKGERNRVAWVAPCDDLVPETLRKLVELGEYLGTGIHRTPASFGYQTMVREYFAANKRRQPAPCSALRQALLDHSLGGRVDTPALGEYLETAWEEDMRSAYPTAAGGSLPVGRACRMIGEEAQYQTWFAECEVVLVNRLAWSPLLMRGELGNRQVSEPGIYTLWLWKEEADEARELGISVVVRSGWGWEKTEAVLAAWVDVMGSVRECALTDELRQAVKASVVGAIGRHGMAPLSYHLVPNAKATVESRPYLRRSADPITDYSIEATEDTMSNALTHWHSYITMQVRLRLFRRILLHIASGNRVLATDYDAIRLEREPVVTVDLPTWKRTALHHVTLRHPRWLESDEKTRRPGYVETAEDFAARLQLEEYNRRMWREEHPVEWGLERDKRRARSGSHIPDDEFWRKEKPASVGHSRVGAWD
jgi:hypothetical protein